MTFRDSIVMSVALRKKKSHPPPTFPSNELIDPFPGEWSKDPVHQVNHTSSAGEITVAQANGAYQLLYFSEKSGVPGQYIVGTLLCTNRRICFVPTVKRVSGVICAHECLPLLFLVAR